MKLRPLMVNLLVAVLSVVIVFGLLEVAARLFWKHEVEPSHVGVVLEGPDRSLVVEGKELRTNSLGLRMDREIEPVKPPGEARLLVLGDSFVWGDGLAYGDLITTKLEDLLDHPGHPVKVINGGHCAVNTTDELAELRRLLPVCRPDLVIVFFFTNDLLAREAGVADFRREREVSWRQKVKEGLRRNSRFFAFLYSVYKDRLSSVLGVPKFLLPSDYFGLDDTKPGWVAFKEAVGGMQGICREGGVDLVFVLIPTLTNLDETYPYAEVRSKTTDFLEAREIPVIDLFDLFAPIQPSELWVSPENSHWNGKGTTLAAAEIVRLLEDRGWRSESR